MGFYVEWDCPYNSAGYNTLVICRTTLSYVKGLTANILTRCNSQYSLPYSQDKPRVPDEYEGRQIASDNVHATESNDCANPLNGSCDSMSCNCIGISKIENIILTQL
jgi:hypothetical protein